MNLLKILNDVEPNGELLDTDTALRFGREAVKQALELASERAEIKVMTMGQYHGTDKYGYFVDKQSILSIIDEIEE